MLNVNGNENATTVAQMESVFRSQHTQKSIYVSIRSRVWVFLMKLFLFSIQINSDLMNI